MSGGEGNLGLRLSLNAGTLAAGTVRSQIATRARAQTRHPAAARHFSARICETMIRHAAPAIPTSASPSVKAWDANWTALENPLVVELAAAAEAVRGERPPFVVRLPGSDARRWRDLGVPAVCYGPQPTLSAGIDDYANEQDVIDCAKIYARTALSVDEPLTLKCRLHQQ